jgi:hypothetical protein
MKIYTVTLSRPWDGKEIVSTHMTRKGALQVACEEMLETMVGCDTYEDSEQTWIQDNLGTLHNPDHTLTIQELDDMFLYAEKLLWEIENEVEIVWHTLQP